MSNGIFVGSGNTSFTNPSLGSGSSLGIDYESYPTYDIAYGQKKEKTR